MSLIVFAFGTIIGSFLGVVIYRMPLGLSVSTGRSRCDTCNRNLTPIDLIPVISYTAFKGSCRTCGNKIPTRFLWVELLTGATFMLSWVRFGASLDFLVATLVASILIVVTFIDIDTMIINDRFQIALFIIGVLLIVINPPIFLDSVIGSVIISVPYFLLAFFTGGIGLGDVKLTFVSGFILGPKGIIVAFVITSLVGGIYAVGLLIKKKASKDTRIPFVPFLAVGIFTSLLYGSLILESYMSLFV